MKSLVVFIALFSVSSAFALTCDEALNCTGHGTVSKKDIRVLSARLKGKSFNGKPFNLDKVQGYFKKFGKLSRPETKDYIKYWDKKRDFDKDYGTGTEAILLFELAKADFYIKKFEADHKVTVKDEDPVMTDYRFIGNGASSHYAEPKNDICIIDAQVGDSITDCEYDEGSSGLFSGMVYLATMGNLGSTDGYRREKTSCVTEKPIHALVRSKVDGKDVIHAIDFTSKGRAVEFDKNVWFRHGLKVKSEKQCELNSSFMEDRLILYSCQTHKPGDENSDKLEFNRSPAVIEQFGRKLKQLQANN